MSFCRRTRESYFGTRAPPIISRLPTSSAVAETPLPRIWFTIRSILPSPSISTATALPISQSHLALPFVHTVRLDLALRVQAA